MTRDGHVLAVISGINDFGKYVMISYNGGTSKLFYPNRLSYSIDAVAGVFIEVADDQAIIHGPSMHFIEQFFRKEGITEMPGHIPCGSECSCWGKFCGKACSKAKALTMN